MSVIDHGRIRVLVVDDTAANRNLMGAFLRKLGFQYLAAENGREAVELFERERPDMILMDLMMPEMDGFEATRRIRQIQGERWVPIVIMSALTSDQDVVAGLDAQADDYLVKPVSFAVFSAKLRTMVRLLAAQRNLEDALGRMSAITDSVIDGIIAIDQAGLIQSANPAVARIFGYRQEDLVGRNVSLLMPEPDRSRHDGHIARYLATGERHVIGALREVMGRRASGEVFTLELGVSHVQLADGPAFIGVVRDVTERLRVQQALADNAARLQSYHDEQEAEQELARSIMARQIRKDWMADPRVQHAVMPTRHFSGDLVVVARNEGRLYAMLADATGHGLAAALSVQPALSTFYRGAASNQPLAALVAEINNQLRDSLPVGRFVGAALLCLDEVRGCGEVWVGGIPEVWLLDGAGQVTTRFPSTHLPLGIEASTPQESQPQTFAIQPSLQVVMASDGVLEASAPGGPPFGPERLLACLAAAGPAARVARVREHLAAHLAGAPAHDDMSVLVVDCRFP
ncbi:MAG: SpoIIE family protein phosphatase [Rhodocyclaceae bacterium]|nr:SpoIIE family protein phosphatase [Rhodocyclaceae bacterium]